MTLTKDRIVELVKEKTNYATHDAKRIVETLLEVVKSKLEQGEEVKISGFGKWSVKAKRNRIGRNPHTGEKIQISARKVVIFHPSEKLREVINNPDAKSHLDVKKDLED